MDDKAGILKTGLVIILIGLLLAGGLFPIPNHRVAADDLPLAEGPPLFTGPEEYVPDEIIVKFKEGIRGATVDELNQAMGAEVIRTSAYAGFKVLQIPEGKTVAEMVKAYSKLSNVEYAEPNYIDHMAWSPNDEGYYLQWHFDQINLEAAWDLDTSSPNYGGDPSIVVAVIDSGVAYETYSVYVQAPDLASTNFWTNSGETPGNSTDDDGNGYVDDINGWDFVNIDAHPNDDNSHGTHVCGTIAQSTNNTAGVAGIAFNTTIMPLKTLDSAGSGTHAALADALHYAADNGAHIVNYSGGGSHSTTKENAVAYARDAGVIIVAAAGNDYQSGNDPNYPAAYDDYAIAVGATRYDQARSPYSNTGSYLDIAAPGGDTTVDQNSDGYADGVLQQTFASGDPTDFSYWFFQGTSMATPHVSGVAALILAEHPTWNAAQVRHALLATVTDKGTAGKDNEYGWGLLGAPDSISATIPVPASFSDAGYTTSCDNFSGIGSEDTAYMYCTSLLSGQNYSVAYYDGGDTRRATDSATSSSSGNLSSNHTFVQGTDVNGTWHVVICDQAHTPPATYSSNWTYAITEDTLTLQFDLTLPTMEPIVEAQGQYFNTEPVLSNFGFDDDAALDDGWYQMDSYNGTWTVLFTDVGATSWDSDNWTIPDFVSLSEGSHTTYFKATDNSSNVEGESGEWGWQFYKDTGPPDDPTSVNSPSHTTSVWSSDNTVYTTWTDATDNLSGLDGYSILWNTANSTIPDAVKDIEEGSGNTTSSELADGSSHYFHIRSVDNAGNWQSTVHLGPFYIETVPPTDPTSVNSTSHDLSTWSSDNTVVITWTDATDGTSGLDGYSVLWNTDNATIPDATKDVEESSENTTSSELASGNNHYFHIRSVDNAGNWQSTVHLGPFYIDTTPPTDPTSINSTSHSLSTWSSDNTVDVSWTDATDNLSGLDGYSILWDTSASTTPSANKTIEDGIGNVTSSELADGNSHYLHIRSVDDVGNWQSTAHLGPFYIAVNAPFLTNGTVSPGSGYTSTNFTFSVNYTDFEDDAPVSITITTDNTTTANMTEQDSLDVDFTDGKIYEYSVLGSSLDLGSHVFQFAASDGIDNAIGDTSSHSGPTVSSLPSSGGGGGGGGGGAGITPLRPYMDSEGKLTEEVIARSEDMKVELLIPEGTVALNAIGASISSIRIQVNAEPPLRPKDTSTVTLVYDMGPAGVTFDPPVDLTMEYDESKIPEGVTEKALVVSTYDDGTGQWTDLESTVATENDTVTAKVSHFSAFAVLAYTRPASFSLANLILTPTELGLGESTSISILVTNDGDLAGSYEVKLEIDDVVIETKEVTLDGRNSETVSFSVTFKEIGEHTIKIGELVETCQVKEVKKPAAFIIQSLAISPAEVNVGESVTISVFVYNTGDFAGSYEINLKIDGVVAQTDEVVLDGGESKEVVFTVTKDKVDSYRVEVDGLAASFSVKEKTPAVPEEEISVITLPAVMPTLEPTSVPEIKPASQLSWWLIGGIIAGVVATGLVSYFVVRKRREAWVLIRARVKSILTVMPRR